MDDAQLHVALGMSTFAREVPKPGKRWHFYALRAGEEQDSRRWSETLSSSSEEGKEARGGHGDSLSSGAVWCDLTFVCVAGGVM